MNCFLLKRWCDAARNRAVSMVCPGTEEKMWAGGCWPPAPQSPALSDSQSPAEAQSLKLDDDSVIEGIKWPGTSGSWAQLHFHCCSGMYACKKWTPECRPRKSRARSSSLELSRTLLLGVMVICEWVTASSHSNTDLFLFKVLFSSLVIQLIFKWENN